MRVATIGTGGIAERHLEVLAGEPAVEVVGHVTRTPGGAERAAARWGGRAYRDTEALLRSEQVEAAWVCVPPDQHGPIEHRLIAEGIPFFVEKPLDADGRTAEGIAEALQTGGVIAGVGYHWRAVDTIPVIRKALQENPARMVVGQWLDSVPPPPWWRHQRESGGQMVEQATHLFDLARLLVGEAHVQGAAAAHHALPRHPDADVADVSAALLRYDGGATGVFTATCALAGSAAIDLRLVCRELLMTVTQGGVVFEGSDGRREIQIGNDPFQDENRAFLAAIRDGQPELLYSSYADALLTHRLCWEVQARSRG